LRADEVCGVPDAARAIRSEYRRCSEPRDLDALPLPLLESKKEGDREERDEVGKFQGVARVGWVRRTKLFFSP
jgi:hypothetical protein